MTILVTGGAGFIGSSFVRFMAKNSSETIYVLDALTYAGTRESLQSALGSSVELVVGDITDASLVQELVSEADSIVHFAAETHNDNSLIGPDKFVSTNIHGTFVLLEEVRRSGRRFHHVSTDEVFGDLPLDSAEKFSEDSKYNPSSPYSATKAASDLLVRAWIRSFGIKATISNCSNNFGPFQHVEKFIPRQITNLLLGQKPKVYGDGKNVRDWIYVDDHSSAVARILEAGTPGETYLIGVEGERNNIEVVQELLSLFDLPPEYFDMVSDRPGHDRRYAINASKIKDELGWRPETNSFRENLARTVSWYRQNRAWWSTAKESTEKQYERLGEMWETTLA